MLRHHRGPMLAALAIIALACSILSLHHGFTLLAKHSITTKRSLNILVQLESAGVALLDAINKDEKELGIAAFQEDYIPLIKVLLEKPEYAESKALVKVFLGSAVIGDTLTLEQTRRVLSILKTREINTLSDNLVAITSSAVQTVTYALIGMTLSGLILVVSACVYYVDQTKRIELEKALLDAKNNLEEKIHLRTKELEVASNAKTEFLGVVSHELRTPLFAITGLTEELERRDTGNEELIDDIKKSASKLLLIINQLLNFTQYDKTRQPLYLQPANFAEFIKENYTQDRIIHHVTSELTIPILLDVKKTKLLIDNLVSNALKFSKETVHINITKEGENMVITITDRGEGIPTELIPEMVLPFKQGNVKCRTGVGLGLTISNYLAKNLSGCLDLHSSTKGTTAIVTLPIQWSHKMEKIPNKLKPYNFLVVEDTALNRKVLGFMLKKLGQTFEFAEDGEIGVTKAKEKQYDVILMDIEMPNMDGFEAAKRIRQLAKYENTPIIVVTAHSVAEILEKAKKVGMNDWITKPVNTADLERLIQSIN